MCCLGSGKNGEEFFFLFSFYVFGNLELMTNRSP